jgi:hypothetical protein
LDADNGIAIVESTFKKFKKDHLEKEIFPGFFNEINKIIDTIQDLMKKGKNLDEMTRVIESESATIIIYYHPQSRVLFCSIADADDNTEKLKKISKKIGNRFWKKHRSDLDLYRSTSEKSNLLSFSADIENLTLNGKQAEVFPKLIVIKKILSKILSMGIISDFEYLVALKCSGSYSPLQISRMFDKSLSEIYDVLKKLRNLDIVTY